MNMNYLIVLFVLLFVLYVMVYMKQLRSQTLYIRHNTDNTNDIEGFNNSKRLIDSINDQRGKVGDLYVKCEPCNRKAKLLESNPYKRCPNNCNCNTCNSNCNNKKMDKVFERYHREKVHPIFLNGKCDSCRDNIARDTVSIWNDDYIDKTEVFCYNCLSDSDLNKWNEEMIIRELPAINGPPGYSVFYR